MSVPITRIEKDFMINLLYNEQIPITYVHNHIKYILKIERYTKDQLYFTSNQPVEDVVSGKMSELLFTYNTMPMAFMIELHVLDQTFLDQSTHFVGNIPESLYKNLDRSHRRVDFPQNMEVKFLLEEDQYILPFSLVDVEPFEETEGALAGIIEPETPDVAGVLAALDRYIPTIADGYKVLFFKDNLSLSFEEQLIAKNAKALFLPAITSGYFPEPDTAAYPEAHLITENLFKKHLKNMGVNPSFMDKALYHFFESKKGSGILADCWIPLLFQGYMIGALRVWVKNEEKIPLDYTVLTPLYHYAQALIQAQKEQGYYESYRIKDPLMTATGVDISSSGIRFSYPYSPITNAMPLNSTVTLKLLIPPPVQRTINVTAQIVRSYKKRDTIFFGCRFMDISAEDTQFLFEYIYGFPSQIQKCPS
ncbi:MAG: PilZ domain-containing protein [Spirochaetaceae bacterium]|jgi:hypothetical protein|nr:PilZ domain-containing protein [Spirochaetaceae bacterium]